MFYCRFNKCRESHFPGMIHYYTLGYASSEMKLCELRTESRFPAVEWHNYPVLVPGTRYLPGVVVQVPGNDGVDFKE